MLLNCIRSRATSPWRYYEEFIVEPKQVMAMPFGEESCGRCYAAGDFCSSTFLELDDECRCPLYQTGNAAGGTAANVAFQSSDDEDDVYDDASAANRQLLDGGVDEVKELIVRRSLNNPMMEMDLNDDGAPKQRIPESSLSDDEFFCAKLPRAMANIDQSANTQKFQNATNSGTNRQRAVRFSEEVSTSASRSHQPPVCNVAPTNFAAQIRTAVSSAGDVPLNRTFMSSASDAAALPPRSSLSPALKFAGGTPTRTISNGDSGDESLRGGYSTHSAASTHDSTNDSETGGEYEEYEHRRPPRPMRSTSAQGNTRNRANIILQHLRADNDTLSSTLPMATVPREKYSLSTSSTDSTRFVFLEFNDEVKRSSFPANIHSIEQLKSLFLRTFPNLNLEYLNLPYVKIYIQESTQSHLFYELDDIKEVKEHSLLKIREQQSHPQYQPNCRNFQLPSPALRYFGSTSTAPKLGVVDYVSEPEMEYGNGRARYRYYDGAGRNHYGTGNASDYVEQPRPASVLPRMENTAGQYYPTRSPLNFQEERQSLVSPITTPSHNMQAPREAVSSSTLNSSSSSSLSGYLQPGSSAGAFFDQYYSGSESSRTSRSSSSTPVMMLNSSSVPSDDESTRQRVDTMERQLAGLSTLVHSALITRAMNPSVRQEMMQLQRQIMKLQSPSIAPRKKDVSPQWQDKWDVDSIHDLSLNRRATILQNLQHEIKNTRDELRQLKRVTQASTHSCRDLLMDAAGRIRNELNSIGGSTQMTSSIVLKSNDELQQNKLDELRKTHLEKLASLQDSLRSFESNVEEIRNGVLNSNRKLRMVVVEQLTNTLTQIGKDSAVLKTQFPELQTELEKEIRRNMENIVREENFIKEEGDQVDECLRRCRNLANMMVTMKKLAIVQDPSLKSLNSHSGSLKYKSAARRSNGNGTTAKVTGVATTIQSTTDANDLSKASALDNILDELNYSPAVVKKMSSASLSLAKSPPKPPERKRYHTTEIRLKYERENGIASPQTTLTPSRS